MVALRLDTGTRRRHCGGKAMNSLLQMVRLPFRGASYTPPSPPSSSTLDPLLCKTSPHHHAPSAPLELDGHAARLSRCGQAWQWVCKVHSKCSQLYVKHVQQHAKFARVLLFVAVLGLGTASFFCPPVLWGLASAAGICGLVGVGLDGIDLLFGQHGVPTRAKCGRLMMFILGAVAGTCGLFDISVDMSALSYTHRGLAAVNAVIMSLVEWWCEVCKNGPSPAAKFAVLFPLLSAGTTVLRCFHKTRRFVKVTFARLSVASVAKPHML